MDGSGSTTDAEDSASAARTPYWDLYKEQLVVAREDQRSSSDEFDKNLMTLSSGALALSVGFIKDVVHLPQAAFVSLLITSWICFALAILTTLLSFLCSGRALEQHISFLYEYYIKRNDEYLNKRSPWDFSVTVCAAVGAIAFFLGVILTVTFTSMNVLKGRAPMADESKSKTTSKWTGVTDARPKNLMVEIPNAVPTENRGRNPMSMTAIPAPTKPNGQSTLPADPKGSSGGSNE